MFARLFKFFLLGVFLVAGAGVLLLREDLKITIPRGLIERGARTHAGECEQRPRYPTHIEIDGKKLPYYPGHTYFVDGKEVKIAPAPSEKSPCVDRAKVTKKAKRDRTSESGEMRMEHPIDAYRPSNIKNMMQTMEKAKKRAKERKEFLEEFAK